MRGGDEKDVERKEGRKCQREEEEVKQGVWD